MDELTQIELQDAGIRNTEGGGTIPTEYHPYFLSMGELNEAAAAPEIPWYKNPTYLAIVGLGSAALLAMVWYAARKDE